MTDHLTSQRIVMAFMWLTDDKARYTYGSDANPSFFSVAKEIWEDMGQPQSITVTIEPGDLLN